jgi:Flp pilus assembly protein TadG
VTRHHETDRLARVRPDRAGPVAPLARSAEDGMVTAEFAVALPAFVLVVLAALGGVVAMIAQLRCVDAADVAARMAARGESTAVVRATAVGAAPGGAQIDLATAAGVVTATVRVRLRLPGLGATLPGVVITERVSDEVEPTALDGAAEQR